MSDIIPPWQEPVRGGWPDPQLLLGLSGLEGLRVGVSGRGVRPPISYLTGMMIAEVDEGYAVFEMPGSDWFLSSQDQISVGSNYVLQALSALDARMKNKTAAPISSDVLPALETRSTAYQTLSRTAAAAAAGMTPDQQQYFYEQISVPLLIDSRQTAAAIKFIRAVTEPDMAAVRKLCFSAFDELKALEDEIRRAERPPFENWYRKSWIRNDDSPYNLHRSYERTRAFLIENYLKP